MKKPAIFIDAYITTDEQKKWLNYNVNNYIKNEWDVFIISNKISSFDNFSNIKYFEYDCRNRILPDVSKYNLSTSLVWFYELFNNGDYYRLDGSSYIHGFTNWTILYNIKKICKVLKNFGYTHAIRCEYDVTFKDYNLMNNVFKSFGETEKSKKCMIIPDGWGCTTNFFLFDVEYLDSKIPELETENDYLNFLNKTYNNNISPIFERMFNDLISKECEYLDKEKTYQYIDKISACESADDSIYRHKICYKKLFMTPVNNNTEFFFYNDKNNQKSIYLTYSTFDEFDNFVTKNIIVDPDRWFKLKCSKLVEIKTSDMPYGKSVKFDLINEQCRFTLIKKD